MLALAARAEARLRDVRVIPQTHPIYGVALEGGQAPLRRDSAARRAGRVERRVRASVGAPRRGPMRTAPRQPARAASSTSPSPSPITQLAARSAPSSSRARQSRPGRGLAAGAARVGPVGAVVGALDADAARAARSARRRAWKRSKSASPKSPRPIPLWFVTIARRKPAAGEAAQRGGDAGQELVVLVAVRVAGVAHERAVAVEEHEAAHARKLSRSADERRRSRLGARAARRSARRGRAR